MSGLRWRAERFSWLVSRTLFQKDFRTSWWWSRIVNKKEEKYNLTYTSSKAGIFFEKIYSCWGSHQKIDMSRIVGPLTWPLINCSLMQSAVHRKSNQFIIKFTLKRMSFSCLSTIMFKYFNIYFSVVAIARCQYIIVSMSQEMSLCTQRSLVWL